MGGAYIVLYVCAPLGHGQTGRLASGDMENNVAATRDIGDWYLPESHCGPMSQVPNRPTPSRC